MAISMAISTHDATQHLSSDMTDQAEGTEELGEALGTQTTHPDRGEAWATKREDTENAGMQKSGNQKEIAGPAGSYSDLLPRARDQGGSLDARKSKRLLCRKRFSEACSSRKSRWRVRIRRQTNQNRKKPPR
jgi:hypothetical protein